MLAMKKIAKTAILLTSETLFLENELTFLQSHEPNESLNVTTQ